jgi:hypothetical protein
MNIPKQIKEYIATLTEPKRSEMQELHDIILALMPTCKLWFLDGKDEKGKTVSNPNIGFGSQTIKYANGRTKEFYQIGISANTTGISVYIMGVRLPPAEPWASFCEPLKAASMRRLALSRFLSLLLHLLFP